MAAACAVLDERDLWPGGDFVTTNIIVSTLPQSTPRPGQSMAARARKVTQWGWRTLTRPNKSQRRDQAAHRQGAAKEVMDGAWSRMRVTYDPISASLIKSADSAYTAGFLKDKPNLNGIYELTLLNQVLKEKGLPTVK
jgi:NitT/TauT family transport system substrate-binding protein